MAVSDTEAAARLLDHIVLVVCRMHDRGYSNRMLDTQQPAFCRLVQCMDAVHHWYCYTSEVHQIYDI